MYNKNNVPYLAGQPLETMFIESKETTALLDTSSCISSLGQSF